MPWIYLRGTFVGGFNALSEVDRLGQLEYATLSTADKATSKLKKVVIARQSKWTLRNGRQVSRFSHSGAGSIPRICGARAAMAPTEVSIALIL